MTIEIILAAVSVLLILTAVILFAVALCRAAGLGDDVAARGFAEKARRDEVEVRRQLREDACSGNVVRLPERGNGGGWVA